MEKPVSGETKDLLDNGVIYQLGRDSKFRPLVILNLSKLSQIKNYEEIIIVAFNHILVMVREKMLLPHHVEKFNVMVDTSDLGVIKNLEGFLDLLYANIRENFPQSLHQLYLMNVSFMEDVFKKWNRKAIFFKIF